MYRHAAKMARDILAEELPRGLGLVDHEFVGRLERNKAARAWNLSLTNGDTPPIPPNGSTLEQSFSVSVGMEYRGHWVKITTIQQFLRHLFELRMQSRFLAHIS